MRQYEEELTVEITVLLQLDGTSLGTGFRRFEGTFCIHLQGPEFGEEFFSELYVFEGIDTTSERSGNTYPPSDATSYPGRTETSTTPL